jgi:hypothetical protein
MKNYILLMLCMLQISAFAQWKPVKNAEGGPVKEVLGDGGNNMVIMPQWGSSFFYSTNGGQNWQVKKRGHRSYPVLIWNGSIVQIDKDSNIVINNNMSGADVILSPYFRQHGMTVYRLDHVGPRFYAGSSSNELYYSDDTCHTWHLIPQVSPGIVAGADSMIFVINYYNLYRSFDLGMSWDSSYSGAYIQDGFDSRGGQIAYYQGTGMGLKYSSDSGAHFIWVNYTGFVGGYNTSLAIGDSLIYIGTEATNCGLYYYNPTTTAKGKISLPNLIDSAITALYYNQGKLWIGTDNDGLYCYDEATHIATKVVNDIFGSNALTINVSGNNIAILEQDNVLASYGVWSRITHSDNYGGTFQSVRSSLTNLTAPDVIGNYVYYISNDSSGNCLRRKTPGGNEQLVSTIQLPGGLANLFHTDSALFYASNRLFRSKDMGLSWDTLLNTRIDDYRIHRDSIYVLEDGRVYVYDKTGAAAYNKYVTVNGFPAFSLAVTDSAVYACNSSEMAISRHNQNYSTVFTNAGALHGTRFWAIGAYNNHLFADVESVGVMVQPPGASSWAWFSQGLQPLDVSKFLFSDSLMYGLTLDGNWLWCRELSDLRFNNISGSAFLDLNNNNVPNNTDVRLPNALVTTSNCGSFAVTDAQGNYTLLSNCDTNEVELYTIIPYASAVVPQNYTVYGSDTGKNFAVHMIPGVKDLRIFITRPRTLRRGVNLLYVTAQNIGSVIRNADVQFIIPPKLKLLANTSPLPSLYAVDTFPLTADTLGWHLPAFVPNDSRTFTVALHVDSTFQLDESLVYRTAITPIADDSTPLNNVYVIADTLKTLYPYDPNHKTVSPVVYGPGDYSDNVPLHYTISFQNTGDGRTETVRLVDTLSNLLNLRTIQVLASSHPYEMTVHGNVVEFLFAPCVLSPDSIDEAGSIGFVSFIIMPESGLGTGNTIPNSAGIYFDRLEPIITNIALVQFSMPSYVHPENEALKISIAPNPANDYTLISIPSAAGFQLELYDINGALLERRATPNSRMIFYTGNTPAGLYFYKIFMDNAQVATGKMVIAR